MKTKAVHTPGPWFVEKLSEDNGNAAVLVGADEIGAPGYQGPVASVVGIIEDNRANAHLIAAAPELLEVAKTFLHTLEADEAECTCEPGDRCPLCRCKDALKKAEGRG